MIFLAARVAKYPAALLSMSVLCGVSSNTAGSVLAGVGFGGAGQPFHVGLKAQTLTILKVYLGAHGNLTHDLLKLRRLNP